MADSISCPVGQNFLGKHVPWTHFPGGHNFLRQRYDLIFKVTGYPLIKFVGAKVYCLKAALLCLFCDKWTSELLRRTL